MIHIYGEKGTHSLGPQKKPISVCTNDFVSIRAITSVSVWASPSCQPKQPPHFVESPHSFQFELQLESLYPHSWCIYIVNDNNTILSIMIYAPSKFTFSMMENTRDCSMVLIWELVGTTLSAQICEFPCHHSLYKSYLQLLSQLC